MVKEKECPICGGIVLDRRKYCSVLCLDEASKRRASVYYKRRYQKEREAIKERNRKWFEAHPEYRKQYNLKLKTRTIEMKERMSAIELAVSGDFMQDMECKLYLNGGRDKNTFTQEEAHEMVKLLLDVFSISHGAVSPCCEGKHMDIVKSYLKRKW